MQHPQQRGMHHLDRSGRPQSHIATPGTARLQLALATLLIQALIGHMSDVKAMLLHRKLWQARACTNILACLHIIKGAAGQQ